MVFKFSYGLIVKTLFEFGYKLIIVNLHLKHEIVQIDFLNLAKIINLHSFRQLYYFPSKCSICVKGNIYSHFGSF